ncbi:MAG: efflux RND transporter periplasmic adaptor subunit [Thermodesulfobacteriota bacterium]|nr:efflux RND transporter periplasmic adaptor subunit [Thermodesulfobacteriota bacterium]
MKKYLMSGLLLLGISVCVACGGNIDKTVTSKKDTERKILVETTKPSVERIVHQLKAVGTLLSDEIVDVSPEISGRVSHIFADEGNIVKKGQLLARLEDERPKLGIESAQATLKEAKANLKYWEVTLQRQTKLLKDKMLSQQKYDLTETQAKLAAAKVVNAEAALNIAKKNLSDTYIYAPFSGIISTRYVSVGEYVNVMRSGKLFNLLSINPIKLNFTLPEKYAMSISKGQMVELETKALPHRKFTGEIYFINPQIDPKTRAIQIKALIHNEDHLLKPGYFADVTIVKDTNEHAFVLPQEAVLFRGKHAIIFEIQEDRAKETLVEVGVYTKEKIEIVSGLTKDTIVITRGNHLVEDGTKVVIVKRHDESSVKSHAIKDQS